jgi:hypothetical protein
MGSDDFQVEVNSTTAPQENTKSSQEEANLVNRVLSYTVVNNLVDVTRGYYTTAKDFSPLVKSVSENLEQKWETGTKLYQEKVAPSLTPVVSPVLSSVDEFGCRQLDRIENFGQVVQTKRQDLNNKVQEYRENGSKQISQAVPALDQYLKNNYVLGPALNVALDVTENLTERFLPHKSNGKEEDEVLEKKESQNGPVYRAASLGSKIGSELSLRFQDLKLRTPEAKKSLRYCVDLIQYAKDNFDSSLSSANQYVQNGVSLEKVQGFTAEGYRALLDAISVLSEKLPENVRKTSTKTLAELSNRKEVVAFTEVLKSNAVKLQNVTESLSNYIKQNEKIPNQLATVTDTLHNVLESLLAKSPVTSPEPSKAN